MMLRAFMSLVALALFCALPACAADGNGPAAQKVTDVAYMVDTGDTLRVTVYGEADMSGEFPVDEGGNIRLPLIGQVKCTGMTVKQLESAVADKLAAGYLVNPHVTIEVATYRPFTILGEVNKPGQYPFENKMSVLNAVGIAGGFTYRANTSTVYIRHKGATSEDAEPADDSTPVRPGDTVRVDERLF